MTTNSNSPLPARVYLVGDPSDSFNLEIRDADTGYPVDCVVGLQVAVSVSGASTVDLLLLSHSPNGQPWQVTHRAELVPAPKRRHPRAGAQVALITNRDEDDPPRGARRLSTTVELFDVDDQGRIGDPVDVRGIDRMVSHTVLAQAGARVLELEWEQMAAQVGRDLVMDSAPVKRASGQLPTFNLNDQVQLLDKQGLRIGYGKVVNIINGSHGDVRYDIEGDHIHANGVPAERLVLDTDAAGTGKVRS